MDTRCAVENLKRKICCIVNMGTKPLTMHTTPFPGSSPILPYFRPLPAPLLPIPGQFHGIFSCVPFQPFPGVPRAGRAAVLGNALAYQPDIIVPQAFQVG